MSKSKERKQKFTTPSGLDVERIYGDDTAGSYPYTRGIRETMYRGRLWTMRQYAGFGTAQEANARYRYLLENGSTGLSVAFDLPTQMGYDADDAQARGEVGKVGVSICSSEDMATLLNGIPLDKVSLSMTINSTAAILLALVLVEAEKQKVPWSTLRGTIQNDILKEYIARGTYIYPPGPAIRIVTDIFEFCSKEVPNWNTVSISGYHIREAGSTAVQELAFTLSNGISYVEAALRSGLKIDDFASRLSFFFNCHNDFLEEIAKFRAARRMWAKIMKERFHAKSEKSMMLRFHTQTAGSSLTAQQPYNNIVRTTVQAMAAVFGGTQSLHTNSFDEALGLPTRESATIALRTQQILAQESGIANAVDPLGGAPLIEEWTDRMEAESQLLMDHIESLGGMVDAIEAGYPQEEIEKAAYEYQRSIESGEQIIVGVNDYVTDDAQEPPIMKSSPVGEAEQVKALKKLRTGRNDKECQDALSALQKAASSENNIMPVIVQCIRAKATLGEISHTFRLVFGEYKPL